MGRLGGQGGWGDRGYPGSGGGGRWRQGLARAFSGNPLSWALPLYRAWGITVKVHIFFILMIVFDLLGSMAKASLGPGYLLAMWGSVWLLVLLHEYGHCFTCRRVGGEADEILMWPLGGLASCRPPHDWRADLWTTIGGPAVNAVLIVPLGALVMALGGGWDAVIFNPFDLTPVLTGLPGSWWSIAAWWLYFSNWMLLLFNVLLPMYPMDGGRMLHAVLWSRMGHRRATSLVVRIGFGVAIGLGIFAIVMDQTRLIGLAIFGGITCFMEWQRLRMMGEEDTSEAWKGGAGGRDEIDQQRAIAQSQRLQKQRAREAQRVQDEEAEVNRLLDKIRDQGMQSLSGKERRFLEEATKRRRGV